MRALQPSVGPPGALGSGSMPANPLIPCASPARLRKASASFVASIPCGSCMVIMKGLAAGVHGSINPPAASGTSPMRSHASSEMRVSRET